MTRLILNRLVMDERVFARASLHTDLLASYANIFSFSVLNCDSFSIVRVSLQL